MSEQIDAAPWTNIQGIEHVLQCIMLWDSIMECARFTLVTIFHNDTTETKRYYIKPYWIPI